MARAFYTSSLIESFWFGVRQANLPTPSCSTGIRGDQQLELPIPMPAAVSFYGTRRSLIATLQISDGSRHASWKFTFTIPEAVVRYVVGETAVRLAHMHDYRLFVYNENGQVVGRARIITAANDAEAIVQAEAMRGSLAAELLDFDGLRIVKRLTPNKKGAVSSR